MLLHPSSLPGPFGIGDLGPGADAFIDWLASAGQSLWQVLPLGPTGYGDSPYAPFSTFAGNELLVSPERLAAEGLVTRAELDAARLPGGPRVDYVAVSRTKKALVRLAAERFAADGGRDAGFARWKADNASWLDDYVLFIDVKERFDGEALARGRADSSWNAFWPAELASREPAALDAWREEARGRLEARAAAQYLFFAQWEAVRARAAARGVAILGDLPIFVAMDSADAWSRPELFDLDGAGRPRAVAGVPPDYFSADGQLWGNPLYDWARHESDGFAWWTARVAHALSLYDMVRIDHFRGLSASWAVPAGSLTARDGAWRPAPGAKLLSALVGRLGVELPIVAEDLGFITDDVRALRDGFGLPGMRILQFGFDARESGRGLDPANPFLPHNYAPRSVAYTGTHDNDTLAGWLAGASADERAFIARYLGYEPADPVEALVREAMKSAAGLVVIPAQDALGLGSQARMNTPGTVGGNWEWRLEEGQLDAALAGRFLDLATLYNRK